MEGIPQISSHFVVFVAFVAPRAKRAGWGWHASNATNPPKGLGVAGASGV
jgi:hypothetical protein